MTAPERIQPLTGLDEDQRLNAGAPVGTPVVVTYSFADGPAAEYDDFADGHAAFSEAHKAHVRQALDTWAASSGIAFIEAPAGVTGQIRVAMIDMTGLLNAIGIQASGYAYFPRYEDGAGPDGAPRATHTDIGGDIFLNAGYYAADADEIAPGIRGYSILLHEIGHALGFKHPFEDAPVIDPGADNGTFTIMSYNRPHTDHRAGLPRCRGDGILLRDRRSRARL